MFPAIDSQQGTVLLLPLNSCAWNGVEHKGNRTVVAVAE